MLFRKLTEERSGSFSAASPPPASSAGCASAQVVVTNSKVARAIEALAIPRLADAKQAVQVRITILLRISIQGSQRVHCSGAWPFAGICLSLANGRHQSFRPRFHRHKKQKEC